MGFGEVGEVEVEVEVGEVEVEVEHLRRNSSGLHQPLLCLRWRYDVPARNYCVPDFRGSEGKKKTKELKKVLEDPQKE